MYIDEKNKSAVKLVAAVICTLFVFFLQPVFVNAQTDDSVKEPENISFNFNLSSYLAGSGAYYFQNQKFHGGFETWISARASGKFGGTVSYFADIGVALINANRELLEKNVEMMVDDPNPHDTRTKIDIYSYPLGYFPYSYKSPWDGFVFPLSSLRASGPTGWPDSTSIGFFVMGGISGSIFNDVLEWRIARIEREAAAVVEGYSLALNKFAQPFIGIDLQLNMFPWLSIYHVTGILEYFSSKGIQTSSQTFQNGFSLTMVSASYKDYVQVDVGSSVIWPKRIELGYLLPTFHLLYQNNIGDFDNLALFGNLKLQYPGLGFIWFSLFLDEANFEKDFFSLDREMYAYQAGLQYQMPFLSSGLLTLSYTKIEPYCYTHQKTNVPWYAQPMEQSYTNHGYGLGYYLPPNSDELKLVLSASAVPQIDYNIQFQMIRHGAEYGDNYVDGSSYQSELNPDGRSSNLKLRKDFLNDGAYQWLFILKGGAGYSLNGIPAVEKIQMKFMLNAGIVFSSWKHGEKTLDNSQYPSRTGIIMDAGFRITY